MDFTIYTQRLFGSESAILWKVVMPPVLYGLHGWIATRMAVAALFHRMRHGIGRALRLPCRLPLVSSQNAKPSLLSL